MIGGVYLAGPSGFTEPGLRWHDQVLVRAVENAGLTALDPWTPIPELKEALALPYGENKRDALAAANYLTGRRNTELINQASAVLAVLDGVDVDSGTASEIGYGAAQGIPVIGIRTDVRIAADNEGAKVNLQVQYFIEESGGTIVRTVEEAIAATVKAVELYEATSMRIQEV